MQETPSQSKSLPVHEWLAIALFIGLLSILTIISWSSQDAPFADSKQPPHHVTEQEIDVRIEGAVEKPGLYRVKKGSAVQDVLFQAKPLPNANLKRIKLDKKLRKGQTIKVPQARAKKKTPVSS